MHALVRAAKSRTAVILPTHSLEEARALCDRVAILRRGELVALGTVRELTARYGGGGHTLSLVLPDARGSGLGKALLGKLAALAVERDCARLEWSVLDWNTPAIDFYKALGARPMDEWTVYRVDGDALTGLAAHSI
jgi:ribosomal protein S18 acetylase RimI-like enzyme